MAKYEQQFMYPTEVSTPGISYGTLLTEGDLIPWNCKYPNLLPAEILEAHQSIAERGLDIVDPDNYLKYLNGLLKLRNEKNIPNPHKAMAQAKLQHVRANEDTTRIIDGYDLPTLYRYVAKLLESGRSQIWISTCIAHDFNELTRERHTHAELYNDPRGKSRPKNSPPRGINSLDELDQVMVKAMAFRAQNPELLFKVFPQDKPNPNNIKIIAIDSPGDKKIILTIRPGENTSSDRTSADEPPRVITVDFNGDLPVVVIEDEYDLRWLQMFLNSRAILSKIDQAEFVGSPFIDVEAFFTNGDQPPAISFVQDVIWEDANAANNQIPCPKLVDYLDALTNNHCLIHLTKEESQTTLLLELRSLLLSKQIMNQVGSILVEAEQTGIVPDRQLLDDVVRRIQLGGLKPPEYILRVANAASQVTQAATFVVSRKHGAEKQICRTYDPRRTTLQT